MRTREARHAQTGAVEGRGGENRTLLQAALARTMAVLPWHAPMGHPVPGRDAEAVARDRHAHSDKPLKFGQGKIFRGNRGGNVSDLRDGKDWTLAADFTPKQKVCVFDRFGSRPKIPCACMRAVALNAIAHPRPQWERILRNASNPMEAFDHFPGRLHACAPNLA